MNTEMEKRTRTARKRIAIQSDDSDEDFSPTKKPRKLTKTVADKSEELPKIKAVNKKSSVTVKRKTASVKKPKESKTLIDTSEVDGLVQTKPHITKIPNDTENADNVTFNMWDESEMLSHVEKVPLHLAQNFIALLTEGCTLPFIARYRKANVDHLMPDRLQELFESYQNVVLLKKKVRSVIETLKKSNKLTLEVEKSLLNARNLSEVDLVYAPLKSHSLSLAERARNLGLEPVAIQALNGKNINLNILCSNDEQLSTPEKVEAHITHIIADIIYKDTRVLEHMRSLKEETRFSIQTSRTKSSTKEMKEIEDKKQLDKKSDPETYKIYFEWKCPSNFVKPHQTLALNRGEDEKVLSVKVMVPDWFHNKLERNFAITPMQQVLIALEYYACGSFQRCIADTAGVNKSSVSRIIHRVSKAIARMKPRWVSMPQNAGEMERSATKFYEISAFPKVIGAIDCTHIPIKSPGGQDAENYRNRKLIFSINVQAICDADMYIKNIVARWPGSSHDSHIFNSSVIKSRLEEGEFAGYWLLGDKGYAVKPYLLTPLRNPITDEEKLYNESQIRTRNVVERMFGCWKRRFPALSMKIRTDLKRAQPIIVATAVLHNMCKKMREPEPIDRLDDSNNGSSSDEEELELNTRVSRNDDNNRAILINNYFNILCR